MALINTIHGPVDESLLQLHRSTPTHGDGAYEFVILEYCVKGCPGRAHRTHKPDDAAFFCAHNVHRSVHAVVVKSPFELGIFGGGI